MSYWSCSAVPSFEGDSTWIAFVSDRDGNDDIFIMRPDGSALRNMTRHPSRDFDPCWAPDGRRIAFLSDRDGSEQLFVMSLDGSDVAKLTDTSGDKGMPAWSPDGQRIAFHATEPSGGSPPVIFVLSIEGRTVGPLLEGMAPSWSPDGNTLAFNRDQLPRIWLADSNGQNARRLGPPDESELNKKEQLELLFRLAPVWSPVGGRLLYSQVMFDPPETSNDMNYDVSILDLETNKVCRLTTGSAYDLGNAWSPTGDRVVFSSDRSGNMDVYVMDVDGSNQLNLTRDSAQDRSAAWSLLPKKAR